MACASRKRGGAFARRSSRSETRDHGAAGVRHPGYAVALNVDAVDVDVAQFERLVSEGTPTALERAIDLYRATNRDLRLNAYATTWLLDITVEKEPATVRSYANLLNRHVLPVLGRIRLRDLYRNTSRRS